MKLELPPLQSRVQMSKPPIPRHIADLANLRLAAPI